LIELNIEIPETLPIEVDAGDDQVIEFSGNAILHAEATFNVLQWLWSPEDFLSCIDCPDPIVQMADKDITYTLQAWDSNGCFAFDELGVMIKKDHQVYVPNVFSPNGDGVNDIFMLNSNSENVTIRSLRIFSRWGELVFERENFPPGDPTYSWDGQLQGRGMNPAVFTWFSQVEFAPGAIKYFSGNVTLIK